MAAAPVPDGIVTNHLSELVAICVGVISPFVAVIGWFLKRMIGRLEKDLESTNDVVAELDERISDCETVATQLRALHPLNHPGQTLK